jgi:nucleoside-diphosphate-sugar epimerase
MSLHVIFGTGPVGLSVASSLLEQGETLRLVNRSGKLSAGQTLVLPKRHNGTLELRAADALDYAQIRRAADGADFIYHCINPLYHQWRDLLPPIQENMVRAALELDAVLAVSENLYSYSRGLERIKEASPENPPSRKGRIRKELNDQLIRSGRERGLRWVSIRASDYYGPGATDQSVFGTRYFLEPLYGRKKIAMMGDIDQPHSYTFVSDFGRALALAARTDKCHGRSWIVAHRETGTTRDLAREFIAQSAAAAKLGRLPMMAIHFAGLFNPVIRELPEMMYQKNEAYRIDGSAFCEMTGFEPTEPKEAVRRTLAWYESSLKPEPR